MGVFNELQQVVDEMRSEAEIVAKWQGEKAGNRIRCLAARLEDRIEQSCTRELTPAEAAAECSWSPNTISRRIRDGTLPPGPSSRKGARTVRRCDLYAVVHRDEEPREPEGEVQIREVEGPDLAGEILSGAES